MGITYRRLQVLALAMIIALGAAACSSASDQAATDPSDITTVPAPTQSQAQEPTREPTPSGPTPIPDPTTTPTPSPTPIPEDVQEADLYFPLDIRPDGEYGYFAAAYDGLTCLSAPTERVVGYDLKRSGLRSPQYFNAHFINTGHIRDIEFRDSNEGAALFSCIPVADDRTEVWVEIFTTDFQGRLTDSSRIDLDYDFEYVFDLRWTASNTIAVEGYLLGTDGQDASRTLIQIDTRTGESSAQPLPEFGEGPIQVATSPDGAFVYSTVPDPNGSLGCEGFGTADVLVVDDGAGPRPALLDPDDLYTGVYDMQFGSDGLVLWRSSCEGFSSIHVGRLADDGRIIDAHVLPFDGPDGGFLQISASRLLEDSSVVALGQIFDGDEEFTYSYSIDLLMDPQFVMSGPNAPVITTDNPLIQGLAGGQWYLGPTTGQTPACGEQTVYREDPDGFARVLVSSVELDTIVDVDVGETTVFESGDFRSTNRVVVFSTECPGEYEGRRVYATVDFGPRPSPLTIGPVLAVEVAEVRRVFSNEDGTAFADVTLIDGELTTYQLATF